MGQLPSMNIVTDAVRTVYGACFDERATVRRYGSRIGSWSFYLKPGRSGSPREILVAWVTRRTASAS